MVTVKRKITNETERYGGYGNTIEIDDNVGSYNEAQLKVAESAVVYSPRPVVTEKPVEKPPVDQFMPTIKKEQEKPVEAQANSIARQSLSSKTKFILGVYLTIVLALASLVIATGIAITGAHSRNVDLENRIYASNQTILAQATELAVLNDEDAITGRAYDANMVKITVTEEVPLLSLTERVEFTDETNAFDRFCDWLNG